MNIIIPLGGKGERFLREGYKQPKALIDIFDKKMIDYVLERICHSITIDDTVFIIYNTVLDEYEFSNYIKTKYNIHNIQLIPIYKQTRGASETIYEGIQSILKNLNIENIEKRTLLMDCDTFYLTDIINLYRNSSYLNAVFCTKNKDVNPIYSYIKFNDETNKITKIIEKEKISDYANTGAYAFENLKKIYDYSKHVVEHNIMFKNEPYISCIIDQMIQQNETFYSIVLDEKKVVSLGTPNDVCKYIDSTPVFMFDLDGTLVITDDIYFNVWKQILSKYNILLTEEMFAKYIHSNNDRYVISTLLHNLDVSLEEISKLKDELFIFYIDKLKIVNGVNDFFDFLYKNGTKICLVTNCNYYVAKEIIKKIGIINKIDFIISGDNVKNGKPNPDPYLLALEKYKIDAKNIKNVCVFEDSKSGIISALNAGITNIIGIETSYQKQDLLNLNISFSIENYNNIELIYHSIQDHSILKKNDTVTTYIEKSLNLLNHKKILFHDNSKLKGGFIADVIRLKFLNELNIGVDCVAKYENVNENGLSVMAKKLDLYDREYYFYSDISSFVPIEIPKFITLIRDENFVKKGIILENMFVKDYQINLNLNTEPIDLTLKIVDRVAKLHSTFWGKDLKKVFPLLKKTTDPTFSFFTEYIHQRYPIFKEKWSNNLTTNQKRIFDSIAKYFDKIQQKLAEGELTFIHGDVKSPNLFYDKMNDNNPCFIDWQHCGIGKGIQDIIFFIIESFDISKLINIYNLAISYYKCKIEEYGIKYNDIEYQKDIKNSLCYVPFFTAIWFGSTPTDELIDPNWPFFFIQKVSYLYDKLNLTFEEFEE